MRSNMRGIMQQFLIGISGALLGVIGWLLVGMYIQRRLHDRQARDAARAVYFEVGANHSTVFTALEYGSFGPLSRATFDRLLPELSTWLPVAELQALVMAYLGHAGYEQMAREPDLPEEARRPALGALLQTHRVAAELLRKRAFNSREVASLGKYVSAESATELLLAGDTRERGFSGGPGGPGGPQQPSDSGRPGGPGRPADPGQPRADR
jgi:hypothetical protein